MPPTDWWARPTPGFVSILGYSADQMPRMCLASAYSLSGCRRWNGEEYDKCGEKNILMCSLYSGQVSQALVSQAPARNQRDLLSRRLSHPRTAIAGHMRPELPFPRRIYGSRPATAQISPPKRPHFSPIEGNSRYIPYRFINEFAMILKIAATHWE